MKIDRISRLVLAGIAAALLAAMALPPKVSAERMTVVPSDVANKEAYVTNKGINWYTSLPDAEAQAKREGKLIFWVHMLGTIDGAT